MKVTKAHQELLATAINRVEEENPSAADEYKAAGLSYARLCFGLYWAAQNKGYLARDWQAPGVSDLSSWPYNDAHIATALRSVTSAKEW